MATTYNKKLMVQLFELTNLERRKHGLKDLIWNPLLVLCSYKHSLCMAKNQAIYHTCPKGFSVKDRIENLPTKIP